MRLSILTALLLTAGVVTFVFAQAPAPAPVVGSRTGGKAPGARPKSDPTPRWPDGHPMLSAAPGKIGFWNAGTGGLTGKGGMNLPTNLDIAEVPFQPWAKSLYEARRTDQQKNDPHARCMPPGGPRQFHTPYGLQLYELPEMKRVLVLSGGGPRTWREIYLDGRAHPSEDDGDFVHGFLGHSVGKWEGDTLVIDTVGFNEQFWFARAGYPHTESLHLTERISRPDYNTLKYEVTIDDPKAYTKPWTGGHYIYWTPDEDFEEYFCQGNNRDADHLVGQ
jgi:hypothetical protein